MYVSRVFDRVLLRPDFFCLCSEKSFSFNTLRVVVNRYSLEVADRELLAIS